MWQIINIHSCIETIIHHNINEYRWILWTIVFHAISSSFNFLWIKSNNKIKRLSSCEYLYINDQINAIILHELVCGFNGFNSIFRKSLNWAKICLWKNIFLNLKKKHNYCFFFGRLNYVEKSEIKLCFILSSLTILIQDLYSVGSKHDYWALTSTIGINILFFFFFSFG